MGFIAVKCPQCGADVQLDDSREYGFCNYCGTKVIQDKVVVEHRGNIQFDEAYSTGVDSPVAQVERYYAEAMKIWEYAVCCFVTFAIFGIGYIFGHIANKRMKELQPLSVKLEDYRLINLYDTANWRLKQSRTMIKVSKIIGIAFIALIIPISVLSAIFA